MGGAGRIEKAHRGVSAGVSVHGSDTYWTIAKAVPMQVGGGRHVLLRTQRFHHAGTRRPGDTPRAFIWRRVKKIHPTHLVAVATLVRCRRFRSANWSPGCPRRHWCRRGGPIWTSLGGLNIPAWSLCPEMLFYLTVPVPGSTDREIADRLLPMGHRRDVRPP